LLNALSIQGSFQRLVCGALLLLMAIPGKLEAQATGNAPILYSITEQNGLSDNSVTCIFQDSRSFMWIGTRDGLNVYDGSTITIFRADDSVLSIANNTITAITEDNHRNVWIGTKHGISRYNIQQGSLHSWSIAGQEDNIDINYISSLYAAGDGMIWMGTSNGMVRFDPGQEKFSIFKNTSEPRKRLARSDNFITTLLIDQQQRFWIGTYNGLWRFYPKDGHFEQYLSGALLHPDSLISSIYQDHAMNLWVGVWSGGLERFDPEKRAINNFSCFDQNGIVTGVAEIKDPHNQSHLYVAPQLREFDPPQSKTTEYLPTSDPAHKELHVTALYASRDNLLWLATNDGVRILDPAKQVFHHYILSDSLLSPQGIVLWQQQDNILLGASGNNFLNKYDSSLHLVKRLLPGFSIIEQGKKINPSLLNITAEDDTHIWLGTEKGLYLYDQKKKTGKLFLADPAINPSPTANFISKFFIDSRGIHWVFPWRTGIWQLNAQTGQFKKIFTSFLTKFGNPKKLVIADAVEDMKGNLWFADLDEGLIHYDRSSAQFSKPMEKILGAEFNLANVLFEKPFVWIVASGKVLRIEVSTSKSEQWPIPASFDKGISGFCMDSTGHIWITTINGLLSFDKISHEFKRFTKNDGLISSGMQEGTLITRRNGKLLYASVNYMTEFDPKELLRSAQAGHVVITGMSSQNKSIEIVKGVEGAKKVELNYNYNNFTFHWALPNFSNPMQNQYYCKLEGVDKDWKYVGNKGEAQYAALEPGTYTFKARAAAGNGLTSKNEDEVTIVIAPPFWRQWWFIVSVAFLIASLLYLLYRYRVQQVIRLERLRSRISSDLHDDIGSTLSSISIISELAMQENSQDSRIHIKEIKDNSISLMEKMDDIVWSINPNNDSLENLMLRVKAFASRLFEAKNIDYRITIRENVQQVKLPMEYRQHIYLILKESINNIVKYAKAKQADIDVSYSGSQLEVKIRDNGVGFEQTTASRGNGIINMQSRAAMMHAQLSIQSRLKEGTMIDLKVKIK